MITMHHLPEMFFDTLCPARPDCPVLIPNTFSMARDQLIAQDLYSYTPCGLPTGDFMPAEQAQIHLMTASPVTLCALIPAPDQVTPEQAYYRDLNFYKKTLFHTPFRSRGRAVTSQEYKDAQVQLEVDHWFRTLPSAVHKYLLCATFHRTMLTVNGVTRRWRTFSATLCSTTRAGGPSGSARCPAAQSPRPVKRDMKHLQSKQHAKGMDTFRARAHERNRQPELLLAGKSNIRGQTITNIKTPYSLRRALLDGRSSHEWAYVQNSLYLRGRGIHRCMRGIPDTEDVTQPGSTKWSKPASRRHRAPAHTRTTRKTERVDLS